ncbi:MAG: hypothetical protein EOO12_03075 [Chitinophagaceae bacterium]|nr:MAG: hypothetical protein EOO12_03075 [Chitinophagaceae bacterium]
MHFPDKEPAVVQPANSEEARTQDIEIRPNPNPRANENLDAAPGVENADTEGVGSEVTDGEDA